MLKSLLKYMVLVITYLCFTNHIQAGDWHSTISASRILSALRPVSLDIHDIDKFQSNVSTNDYSITDLPYQSNINRVGVIVIGYDRFGERQERFFLNNNVDQNITLFYCKNRNFI